jgi:hypothetical protein
MSQYHVVVIDPKGDEICDLPVSEALIKHARYDNEKIYVLSKLFKIYSEVHKYERTPEEERNS